MLQKKIYGQASITLKNTVSDIQDKFRDIQKLEASVHQCVQLFNELSALVFAQGEKIDSIEANVAECKDYIDGAEKQLIKAKEHHSCSKKCMCIAIVIALIVLVIIVIAVVATK
jgi:t-SNARE complex subunit (syntaxin)